MPTTALARRVKDLATGQTIDYEGRPSDVLPNDNNMIIDIKAGEVLDPRDGISLNKLPSTGTISLPRTTWYASQAGASAPAVFSSVALACCPRCGYAATTSVRPLRHSLASFESAYRAILERYFGA